MNHAERRDPKKELKKRFTWWAGIYKSCLLIIRGEMNEDENCQIIGNI